MNGKSNVVRLASQSANLSREEKVSELLKYLRDELMACRDYEVEISQPVIEFGTDPEPCGDIQVKIYMRMVRVVEDSRKLERDGKGWSDG